MNLVFVCQRGELELKALLLACSLRATHGANLRLFAACPDYHDWGHLHPHTDNLLGRLGVTRLNFVPPFGESYPIGNKLAALALLPDDEPGCFLDSDMLSLSGWNLTGLLAQTVSAAKPADLATWGKRLVDQDAGQDNSTSDATAAQSQTQSQNQTQTQAQAQGQDAWSAVYAALKQPLPQRRVRTTVSGELSQPYFNAGVVASCRPYTLAQYWLEFARTIAAQEPPLPNLYPWLDQITLPAAMAVTGPWQTLTEEFNFPAHVRPLGDLPVALCHYHTPGVIMREPRLWAVILEAMGQHPQLLELAARFPGWTPVVNAVRASQAAATQPAVAPAPELSATVTPAPAILLPPAKSLPRDFIITGVPRSGTSYISSLLDSQQDWLVLNEPVEIFEQLFTRPDASGVALCHQVYRERVLHDLPIQNKVEGGKVITDTAKRDERVWYKPELTRGDFWLGSKNTLAYTSALDHLLQLGWPIIAMVRHPLDSLASWRNTFGHLAHAQVDQIAVTNPDYGGWRNWQRKALLEIAQQNDAAVRRVLLWRMLARTFIQARDDILLWRYEDLVNDPAAHLEQINRRLGYSSVDLPEPSSLRARTKHYDEQERDLLGDLCGAELRALSYQL